MEKEKTDEQNELETGVDSLEARTTTVEDGAPSGTDIQDATGEAGKNTDDDKSKKPKRKKFSITSVGGRFNIYLLLFLLMVVISVVVSVVGYIRSRDAPISQDTITTEPLSQEALDKLKSSDVRVGDPKQILNIQSNAIFDGKVLIRDGLEVAGQLKIGGPLNLPGITVSGTSNFDQVQLKNLEISGNTTVQGQLTVLKGLSVSGPTSFAGTLSAAQFTIENLQVNRDIQLNRHIDAGGSTPGFTNGNALGGGGTASLSGTDTAGTVNINAGGGAGNGCFVTVNFTQRFNAVPHVVITPIGPAGAAINYYVNRTATNFSICAAGAVSGSFAFDYIAID